MPVLSLKTAAVGLMATLALGALAPAAAHATGAAGLAKGKMLATTASHILPTTASQKLFTLKKGKVLTFYCKINGVPVDGNPRWYRVADNNDIYFAPARYVKNLGKAPKSCDTTGFISHGKVTAKPSLTKRTKPTTHSAAKGTIRYGSKIDIVCETVGSKVGGTRTWYQLTNGRWVTARYVKDIGRFPPHRCSHK